MKRVILMYLLFASLTNYAQEWTKKINDADFNNRRSRGLKIGDKIPNLPLGTIINNNNIERGSLSDFKGKLVILDFWATYCSSCIAGFPKMEALQKEFGDKIQIILVNPVETAGQIQKHLPKFKFPNLPCFVLDSTDFAKKLMDIFPLSSVGHQVWVDGNGIIKLRGSSLNNTSEKIRNVLDGKEVFILKDNSTAPAFDKTFPYHKLLGSFNNIPITSGSFITPFNNEYNPEGSGRVENVVDSVTGTKRNTYINCEILELIALGFKNHLKDKQKVLYGPHPKSTLIGRYGYNYFILPEDTLKYTYRFLNEVSTIKENISSKICYEQVIPTSLSDEKQQAYMIQDLNRYLESRYGTVAKLEKKKILCYTLVRTSNFDKIRVQERDSSYKVRQVIKDGRILFKHTNSPLSIIGDYIMKDRHLSALFLKNAKSGDPFLLLNETGFQNDRTIDIVLPAFDSFKSLQDLRKVLQPYDLDIRRVEREIDFVIIKDNSSN